MYEMDYGLKEMNEMDYRLKEMNDNLTKNRGYLRLSDDVIIELECYEINSRAERSIKS